MKKNRQMKVLEIISKHEVETQDELIELLHDALPGKKKEIDVLIPYSESRISAMLHDGEVILEESYEADGTKIKLMADEALYAKLRNYIAE